MAEFKDDERFFRKIPNLPNYIMENEKGERRISSAAFKDPRGCSVDRQANRTPESIQNKLYVQFCQKKSGVGAVADVSFKDCCDADAVVKEMPSKSNPFHCEIHRSETQIELSRSQLRKLAQNANIKFFK